MRIKVAFIKEDRILQSERANGDVNLFRFGQAYTTDPDNSVDGAYQLQEVSGLYAMKNFTVLHGEPEDVYGAFAKEQPVVGQHMHCIRINHQGYPEEYTTDIVGQVFKTAEENVYEVLTKYFTYIVRLM